MSNSASGYHVLVGERDVGAKELGVVTGETRITILPALAGAKQAGVLQVVRGAVLIAGGAVLSVYDHGAVGRLHAERHSWVEALLRASEAGDAGAAPIHPHG